MIYPFPFETAPPNSHHYPAPIAEKGPSCESGVRTASAHFWISRGPGNELSVKTSEILAWHRVAERMVWSVSPLNLAQRRKLNFSCFGMAAPPQRWPRLPCPWQRPHGSVGGNPHGRLGTARRISGHRASDGEGHAETQSRFQHSREQMGGHRHAGPGGLEASVPGRKGSAWAHETNLSTAIVRAPSAGPGTAGLDAE